MQEVELMTIHEVRRIVQQLVCGELVPEAAVKAARSPIYAMCEEGARYGLTESEVIKALLKPVFQGRRDCDCSACRAHRGETGGGEEVN